jgi:peptide/nickel transport system ATP-binding protein
MYAGQIVEYGAIEKIFDFTSHPYTEGLFGSLPSLDKDVHRLRPIEGLMADPANLPVGCNFSPRCFYRTEECLKAKPELKEIAEDHFVRCYKCKQEGWLKNG